MRNPLLIFLLFVCAFNAVCAQPSPRHVTINLNDVNSEKIKSYKHLATPAIFYNILINAESNPVLIERLRGLIPLHSLILTIDIKTIPAEISLLSDSVKEIEIYCGEKLSDITALNNLKNLETLSLIRYSAKKLPDLPQIPKLKTFNMLEGKVENIDKIFDCKSLQKIDLYGLDSVKIIEISANNIEDISLRNFKNLKDINSISNCKALQKISLYELPSLRAVNITPTIPLKSISLINDNSLKNLDNLSKNHFIKGIYLFGLDSLKSLNFNSQPMNLTLLQIEECQSIKSITGISNCKYLNEIILRNNPLLKTANLKNVVNY